MTTDDPPLRLIARETFSGTARRLRREFLVTARDGDVFAHEEERPPGPPTQSYIDRRSKSPGGVAALGALLERIGFAAWPVARQGDPLTVFDRRDVALAPDAVRALFDALDHAARQGLRPYIGGSGLDTTYTQRLEYFDGVRVHATEFVWGTERGIGTSWGGNDPTPSEGALRDSLTRLLITPPAGERTTL